MHPRKKVVPTIDDVMAFSVNDFCRRYGISNPMFYKYRGDMPKTFSIGRRVLISRSAAEAWREAREKLGDKVA